MRTHRFEPGLSIKCRINSCSEKYTNYESFRSHVYCKHEEVLNIHKDTHNHGSQEDEHIIEIPLAKDGPSDGESLDEDESFYGDKMEEQMTDGDTELKHSAAIYVPT